MSTWSVFVNSPQARALTQENLLERQFHDSLFPQLQYRAEASPVQWPANTGDSHVFTGAGLMKKRMKRLKPGTEPQPSTYPVEQWSATLGKYADTIDTDIPSSNVAIANMLLRNAHQLGLGAGQTMNAITRNRLYNAALSGQTVADGGQGPTSTLRVKRLNGFTKSRGVGTVSESVAYVTVSGSNPLTVHIWDTSGPGADVTRTVTGFTPDDTGPDAELGPGTLTLTGGNVTVADRAYVLAEDRSFIVRVGGGTRVDDVGTSDRFKLADVRSAVARLQDQNVAPQPDGRYHCHLDPTSQSQIFSDPEWQRLMTGLPDYAPYKNFLIAEVLGSLYFRNSEASPAKFDGYLDASFSEDDPFGAELWNTGAITGMPVHRPLYIGDGAVFEYYQDLEELVTEAGLNGKMGDFRITNDGVEIPVERVKIIVRAPLDRLGELVSTSWKFIGDWPTRTDSTTGDAARYKRVVAVEHGG